MKIAMIGQKGVPAYFGGVERQVEELGARLAEFNEVTVYNRGWFSNWHESEYRGMKVVTLPSIHTKHLDTITHTLFATLHAIINGYDVLHYHGVGPSLVSWIPRIWGALVKIFLKKEAPRIIVTFHCIDRKHMKWGFIARMALRIGEWTACKFAHKTIAVSQQIQRYANEAYDEDCIYIPYGVMDAVEVKSENSIRERFGLKRDGYALVVTRFIPHKGLHYLIAAWKLLKTDKKLVIVGDGYFTDSYVQYVKRLAGGDERIIFTGFLTGDILHALYSHATCVVQPSEAEGLSIALLEAMSYGKPTIASDIPENKEALGDAGIYFATTNVADLRRKLELVFGMYADEKAMIGAASRERIEELHDWKKIIDSTYAVYAGEEEYLKGAVGLEAAVVE